MVAPEVALFSFLENADFSGFPVIFIDEEGAITTLVEGEGEVAFFAESVVNFGVHIPKVVSIDVVAVFENGIGNGLCEEVEVGSSESQGKGGSFFP